VGGAAHLFFFIILNVCPLIITRNWDYRFSWVRDSSFTIYILLRLGFTEEADAYMEFINERFQQSTTQEGGLPIMFTIRGETEIPEVELDHLDGYRGSKPVRIGNGAAFHQQFDIYGELMDGIYLYNKYGKPISWDTWVSVRKMLGTSSPSHATQQDYS
jgi:GH15 family glucan-1,4-alpha-glucosidase